MPPASESLALEPGAGAAADDRLPRRHLLPQPREDFRTREKGHAVPRHPKCRLNDGIQSRRTFCNFRSAHRVPASVQSTCPAAASANSGSLMWQSSSMDLGRAGRSRGWPSNSACAPPDRRTAAPRGRSPKRRAAADRRHRSAGRRQLCGRSLRRSPRSLRPSSASASRWRCADGTCDPRNFAGTVGRA